jgi:hypothetical protein
MGLNTSNTGASLPVLAATANYSFDTSQLNGDKLLVGLLDPTTSGSGLVSLQFIITREQTTVENQVFTSAAAAAAYFDDHVLDLGAVLSGVSGTLDLSISLAMVSTDTNTRFGTTLLVAEVGPHIFPGDYTNDGTVDVRDYVMWRKLNGTSTQLPNDPNPLPIDTDQYNTWRTNFGQVVGSGATVDSSGSANFSTPEPCSTVLILGSVFLVGATRHIVTLRRSFAAA